MLVVPLKTLELWLTEGVGIGPLCCRDTEAVDGNIARMLRKRSNASEVAVAVLTHGTNVMEERANCRCVD